MHLDSSVANDPDGSSRRPGTRDFFADARVVIVVGKGGVGKTVLTATLALAGAERGLDTLIVEVDGKNHVATVFGTEPGGYEERVLIERVGDRGQVSARTITPERALADYLDEHGFGRIADQLSRAGLIDLLATSTPGIKDLLVLGKIKHLAHSSPANLILIDAPASGHAVTFLRSAATLANIARSGRIHRQAVESLEMLQDHARCQVLLVTLPEETPINETVETAAILRDDVGVRLGPVVVNAQWKSAVRSPTARTTPAARASSAWAAARFERAIADRHDDQRHRLAAALALPIVDLPAVRDSEIDRPAIDGLARLLGSQLDALPEPVRPRRSRRRPAPDTAEIAVGADGPLRRLVLDHSIIVCAGPGGVGKTTAAAALAISAARLGRRAVVVTIDPARRLADALGIDALTNEPAQVAGDWSGTLHAAMLDAKRTFDDLIVRASRDEDQAVRVLSNRFYQNLSTGLSGSQELMAMERLHQLHTSGDYDLIVVDTPPTRNALAFLDAPGALTRLLDSRLFRALTAPGRGVFRMMSRATQTFVRQIGRIIGAEVVDDAVAFLQAVDGIIEGFQLRTEVVVEQLASHDTAFVLVASARRDTVAEATWFLDRLVESGLAVRALVVNRLTPDPGPDVVPAPARVPRAWAEAAVTLRHSRALEDVAIAALIADVGPIPVARLPMLVDDVHDLATLGVLADLLVGRGRGPSPKG